VGAYEAFDRMATLVDYPMYVVTAAAADDGERAGCLVGFAGQCSIDPPRFLVCLSTRNRTYRVAQRSDVLAVHLLAADDHDNAELFGGETGDEIDKFARCRWEPGLAGMPVLLDAVGWFAGRVLERIDLGDHVGHLLAPLADTGRPPAREVAVLTFHAARTVSPGHPA
jgi:flavin reductase (DIM6/NTAB) family NADH-FMN oxidoreductase RutF